MSKNMHARWCQFLQKFPFKLQHKSGVHNVVAYTLSRRAGLLITLSQDILGFKQLKDCYADDDDFGQIWKSYASDQPVQEFYMPNGYLMRSNQLCLLRTSL